jgi:hypothetical protein
MFEMYHDAMKVIKGNSARVGTPIISCAITTSSYHGLCDIGASVSVIPYILLGTCVLRTLQVKHDAPIFVSSSS